MSCGKQRAARREKALAFVRTHEVVTALEIGRAAVAGEAWAANRKVWRRVEAIGLELACRFVKIGAAKASRSNEFSPI